MRFNLNILYIFLGLYLNAQKVGYVDTKYLLENNQEYIESKKYVKNEIEEWNTELNKMKEEYEKERANFLNEKILLTKEQIVESEKKIDEKKKKIIDFEKAKFGPDGELIKSQLTIINPIQNKIWNSVQTISKRRGLSMVLDKGSESGPTIIFSDPRYDITTSVLDYMNNPNKKEKKEPKVKKTQKVKDKNKATGQKEDIEEKNLMTEEEVEVLPDPKLPEEKILDVKNEVNSIDKNIKKKELAPKKEEKKKVKTLSEKIKELQKNKNK